MIKTYSTKQILTGLLVTKIYKNRTLKISLFNYSMLGYISPIITSLFHIYRRNSSPTHIFKPTHQTRLQASSHPGIFQTNLPLISQKPLQKLSATTIKSLMKSLKDFQDFLIKKCTSHPIISNIVLNTTFQIHFMNKLPSGTLYSQS